MLTNCWPCLLACSFILIALAIANAQNNNRECATQKANIQQQIDYARTYNIP